MNQSVHFFCQKATFKHTHHPLPSLNLHTAFHTSTLILLVLSYSPKDTYTSSQSLTVLHTRQRPSPFPPAPPPLVQKLIAHTGFPALVFLTPSTLTRPTIHILCLHSFLHTRQYLAHHHHLIPSLVQQACRTFSLPIEIYFQSLLFLSQLVSTPSLVFPFLQFLTS